MNYKTDIWVLVDSKIGSNNQAITLAEKLNKSFCKIEIEYNSLAAIPNFLMPKNFIQLKSPDFRELIQIHTPKLIISASRKTAMVSAAIKKYDNNIQNIHILRPNLSFDNFDLVVLPQHDRGVKNEYGKILRYIGALNNINAKIDNKIHEFSEYYLDLVNHEYISVLIGGNTKKYKFSKKAIHAFVEKLKKISHANNLKLFITFSRRTPQLLKDVINKEFSVNNLIYDPESEDLNPYPSMLKNSKFVLATCDSVSMISEIVSTGKPLFLYIPEDFNSFKHKTFAYQLMDLGLAKMIQSKDDILQEYNYVPLNESDKVADYVNSNLLSVK